MLSSPSKRCRGDAIAASGPTASVCELFRCSIIVARRNGPQDGQWVVCERQAGIGEALLGVSAVCRKWIFFFYSSALSIETVYLLYEYPPARMRVHFCVLVFVFNEGIEKNAR